MFKTCFTKEPIEFDDMCETKSVQTALYLDMNEPDSLPFDNEPETSEVHNYIFVGKVGRFCPIKPGFGGGWLVREADDPKTGGKKYVSATGAKGYRWMESEMVRELHKEDAIDRSYYDAMVDEAINTISTYGDYEWFISNDIPENGAEPWFSAGEPFEEPANLFAVR